MRWRFRWREYEEAMALVGVFEGNEGVDGGGLRWVVRTVRKVSG